MVNASNNNFPIALENFITSNSGFSFASLVEAELRETGTRLTLNDISRLNFTRAEQNEVHYIDPVDGIETIMAEYDPDDDTWSFGITENN